MKSSAPAFALILVILSAGCIQVNVGRQADSGDSDKGLVNSVGESFGGIVERASGSETHKGASPLLAYKCEPYSKARESTPDPYYDGPLFDAHMHMPSTFPLPKTALDALPFNSVPEFGKDITMAEIMCQFENENIRGGIGFFLAMDPLLGSTISEVKKTNRDFPGKMVAFLMPAPLLSPTFSPQRLGEIYNSNPSVFSGYGELATYFPVFRGTSPNDEAFLEIFKVAEKHGQIIMLHPTPENLNDLKKAMAKNPNVTFLLHGGEIGYAVPGLVKEFGNVYYSIDAELFPFMFEAKSKEEFTSHLEGQFEAMMEQGIAKWKSAIEANPDRYVWGTDRLETWHYDRETGAMLVEFSRAFIGRLDQSVQEKFAYKNAERMLSGYRDTSIVPPSPDEVVSAEDERHFLEGICSGEENCNAFCMDNFGICSEYCNSHPDNLLCKKGFSFK